MSISEQQKNHDAFSGKVLIVDDEPQVLRMLGEAVGAFGFEHALAEDGQQALKILEKDPSYSVIITDMTMPSMNGMELLKHINKNYQGIAVIVVSGYTELYNYTDVIRAGASDFISKPFNIDELEAKLNRVIREQLLTKKLEYLSLCDVLTDLYNRRCFDMKLHEEIPRAHRQGYPVFLALIDIDKFKKYNDQEGHQAGDRVLQFIGENLKKCTRENVDWSFRYGGDEFAVIIPYTTTEQALLIAERIITQYREGNFSDTSLSVGLAQFVRNNEKSWEEDINDLVRRADKALYKAKSAGGNKVSSDASVPLPK